jgi:hypothetical protein
MTGGRCSRKPWCRSVPRWPNRIDAEPPPPPSLRLSLEHRDRPDHPPSHGSRLKLAASNLKSSEAQSPPPHRCHSFGLCCFCFTLILLWPRGLFPSIGLPSDLSNLPSKPRITQQPASTSTLAIYVSLKAIVYNRRQHPQVAALA